MYLCIYFGYFGYRRVDESSWKNEYVTRMDEIK